MRSIARATFRAVSLDELDNSQSVGLDGFARI
jgi:hypothetical protein